MRKKVAFILIITMLMTTICGCSKLPVAILRAVLGKNHKEETVEVTDPEPGQTEAEGEPEAAPAPEPGENEEEAGDPVSICYKEDYQGEIMNAEKISISESEYSVELVFSAASTVKDFRIYRVSLTDPGDGDPGFEGSAVYSADELTKEKPLLVTLTFYGDLPEYAYSYKMDGEDLCFTFSQSGMDGSLVTCAEDSIRILEGNPLYTEMANFRFYFMSGVGAWETHLELRPDGSFEGLYYDYDMGDIGPGYEEHGTVYWCDFTGKLGTPMETDPYCYEAEILELTTGVEPGEEEIKDGQRKIYTGPNGLEDADKLIIYAPMMSTELLPEDYLSWVRWEFYDSEVEDMVLPAKMPFYGLYNPTNGCGFYSENLLVNNYIFSNLLDLPGVVNIKDDFDFVDQTYTIIDRCMDDFSTFNSCFYNKEQLDLDEDRDRFVEACLKNIIGDEKAENLHVYGKEDDEWMHELVDFWGSPCLYAFWDLDSGVSYSARFFAIDRFIYVYAVLTDEETQLLTGEAERFMLSGLSGFGLGSEKDRKYGRLKSTDERIDKKLLAIVTSKTSVDGKTYYLVSDEVEMVSSSDTEAMKKYGLTEEDMDNDYAIVGKDGKTADYPIAEHARFFLQNTNTNIYYPSTLISFLNDGPQERMMMLYLNEKGEAVFGYEPYTP